MSVSEQQATGASGAATPAGPGRLYGVGLGPATRP